MTTDWKKTRCPSTQDKNKTRRPARRQQHDSRLTRRPRRPAHPHKTTFLFYFSTFPPPNLCVLNLECKSSFIKKNSQPTEIRTHSPPRTANAEINTTEDGSQQDSHGTRTTSSPHQREAHETPPLFPPLFFQEKRRRRSNMFGIQYGISLAFEIW